MTAVERVRSPRGREIAVIGDLALLTMDRLEEFTSRVDSDPRIATVSLVAGPDEAWLRGTAPAGVAVAVATDLFELVGALDPEAGPEELAAWARRASERGLWHDWLVTRSRDVAVAPEIASWPELDVLEAGDPSSSRHAVMARYRRGSGGLTVSVDVTWLGPFQTGSQVLTTSAIEALAQHSGVASLRLFGLEQLPAYAAHLHDVANVDIAGAGTGSPRSDIVWYPNQIDGRSHLAGARLVGARLVTTYLDLIAYDIPRYHGSPDAWLAYRALQRRVALSSDGITTISADVATHLMDEIPRLDPERVLALPLGLDHVKQESAPEQPGEDIAALVRALGGKRYVLVLGNDFQHKNRDFAIKAWQRALQAGQPCELVLAGLHVRGSSSKADEDDLVARHLDLRGRIHAVGHVEPASREWLLAHATAVLYPSSAEGFGFVPYEAAALGTPSVFTDFGPLREISQLRGLPATWSVDAYSDDLVELLASAEKRAARVDALRMAIERHTWAGFAAGLVTFFDRLARMPEVPTSSMGADTAAADAAAVYSIQSSRVWRAAAPLRRMSRRFRGN